MRWMKKSPLLPRRLTFRAIIWSMCCGAIIAYVLPSSAQDIQESLPAINDTADRICATVPIGGLAASSEVKAELNSLLRKLGGEAQLTAFRVIRGFFNPICPEQ